MTTGLPFTLRNPTRRAPEPLAVLQGIYYTATGVWLLLSPGTFQAVTGPKRDFWLAKTVGVLVSVIGGVLASAGARRAVSREVAALAAGSAAGLAAIDIVYVSKGRISPVYLLDAAAELALVYLWARVVPAARPATEAAGEALRTAHSKLQRGAFAYGDREAAR